MNALAGTLFTYSQPWQDASLLGLLEWGQGQPRLFWESEKSPISFAGIGIAAQVTGFQSARFDQIASRTKEIFGKIIQVEEGTPPEALPIFAGGFSFCEGDSLKDAYWSVFADGCFIVPKIQLTRHGNEYWVTVNHLLKASETPSFVMNSLRECVEDLIWEGLPGNFDSPVGEAQSTNLSDLSLHPYTSQKQWVDMVDIATNRIRSGEFQKVVLARALHAELQEQLNLPLVLAHLSSRYPDCYRFLFEPEPGRAFFGATPELLANVSGRTFQTVALAGSISRGSTWQEDQQLGHQLLKNPKERSEHDWVVRELRESLSPFCTDLDIPKEPDLCLLNNIQHLKTPVVGQLANGKGIIPVVKALHPTPALGGFPRAAALPVIDELEALPRGWYGAPIGWLNPNGDGEFAVAIRSAVANQKSLRLYAGAGIVADSDADREWRETELKFKPILNALGL